MKAEAGSVVVKEPSTGECKVLDSSFVAEIGPLESKDGFKQIYDSFRKKHQKAAHIPYAFRVNTYSKSSDDGEPGSSAGRPLLSLLEESGLEGCYVVVARYFSGTKLGIPRLRRSIVEAAERALENAKLFQTALYPSFEVSLDFGQFESLKRQAPKKGIFIDSVSFGSCAVARLHCSGRIQDSLEELGVKTISIASLGECEILTEVTK